MRMFLFLGLVCLSSLSIEAKASDCGGCESRVGSVCDSPTHECFIACAHRGSGRPGCGDVLVKDIIESGSWQDPAQICKSKKAKVKPVCEE